MLVPIFLVFSSCTYRKTPKVDSKAHQEMKCSDVPFYFNAQLIKGYEFSSRVEDAIYCAYQVEADPTFLIDFYHQEMELRGWQRVAQFYVKNHEYVLNYENPSQSCIISIRLQPKKIIQVFICIGKKEYNFSDVYDESLDTFCFAKHSG